jgi:hypothetical protein
MDNTEWFFLGTVERKELYRCKFLCRQYQTDIKIEKKNQKTRIYVADAVIAEAIREEIWDHKWALHKDWLSQNEEYIDFDPVSMVEDALDRSRNTYVSPRRPVPVGFPKPYRKRK